MKDRGSPSAPLGRVHGVPGFRVIDASIIPVALTAQELATIMLAENLAEAF